MLGLFKQKPILNVALYANNQQQPLLNNELWIAITEAKQDKPTIKTTKIIVNAATFTGYTQLLQQADLDIDYRAYKLNLISTLPLPWIWCQSFLDQQDSTKHDYYQTVLLFLQQKQPLAINQLAFDYISENNIKYIQQNKNIAENPTNTIIHVATCQQHLLQQYLLQFKPLKLTVLDVIPAALLRYFKFHFPQENLQQILWIYQTKQFCLVIAYTKYTLDWQTIYYPLGEQTPTNLQINIKASIQQATKNFEAILISTNSQIALTLNPNYIIKQHYQLATEAWIAKGLALWKI